MEVVSQRRMASKPRAVPSQMVNQWLLHVVHMCLCVNKLFMGTLKSMAFLKGFLQFS